MLKSKHFKTEWELLEFCNSMEPDRELLTFDNIVSIVKDVTNGDWVIFYTK